MQNVKVATSRRSRAPIASPASAECQDGNFTNPSPCMAEGADAAPERTSASIAVEACTGGIRAETPALPAASDRPRAVVPDKDFDKYLKKARAALEALEGLEREVKGPVPDFAGAIETLQRLQVMNRKLLARMRAQQKDWDKTLRELKEMLDQRDDFASTWMG